jgi:hypothetical protein
MAAEADEFHRRPPDGNYKTCLTRIGLLMEGGNLVSLLRPSLTHSFKKFISI